MFELFDPEGEVAIHRGKLPHWYQPGVTHFITFRTADSIPRSVQGRWHAERDEWLRNHGIDPDDDNWRDKLERRGELHSDYHKTFTRAFMDYLDRGHGSCPLRNSRLAAVVGQALHEFDGDRYELSDFVVMPNHVHVLVCLRGNTQLKRQCRSWKTFTAKQINESLDRHGRLWQPESFDHLVRSESQFDFLRQYIADNPQKAGLSPGQYLHYSRPK